MDLFNEGLKFYRNGEFEEAKDIFKRALEENDSNPKIWNSLGIVHTKLGQYEEAEKYYETALIIDPGNESYEKNFKINAKKKIQNSSGEIKKINSSNQQKQIKRNSNFINRKSLAMFFIASVIFLGICLSFFSILSIIQGTWPSLIKPIISLCFFCWMKTNNIENSI